MINSRSSRCLAEGRVVQPSFTISFSLNRNDAFPPRRCTKEYSRSRRQNDESVSQLTVIKTEVEEPPNDAVSHNSDSLLVQAKALLHVNAVKCHEMLVKVVGELMDTFQQLNPHALSLYDLSRARIVVEAVRDSNIYKVTVQSHCQMMQR